MEITRKNLINKYLIKDFHEELDFYEASMNYRIECLNNNISDNENIVKYFNKYEIKNIVNCIKNTKQTNEYKQWFNKTFGSEYFVFRYKKKRQFNLNNILKRFVLTNN